ncbi:MAG: type III-A CRISPR-associated RAMP protein Csm5 [Christensenellaceae bacterium]|nr:type III-A CRISPR-associated RAMP protein Csm5 [Christensenellaceae bacterium]
MKYYDVNLEVLTPVHVGNGKKISKKDFILDGGRVNVCDPFKLYKAFPQQYEAFMMDTNSLTNFLTYNRIGNYQSAIKYSMPVADAGSIRNRDSIDEFIKDPHGLPYIPGSTLKGYIRTAILNDLVRGEEFDKFRDINNKDTTAQKIEELKFGKISESIFKSLIISDSLPLSTKDLIVCKKVDITVKGNEPKSLLNLCRECLRPGTKIKFKMAIKHKGDNAFPYDANHILDFIAWFAGDYRDNYSNHFNFKAPKHYDGDILFLGGGVGYASKTINYSLYERKDAVKKIAKDLAYRFGSRKKPDMHNHEKDIEIGVSPHILKCTKVNGVTMEMGICRIGINEIEAI